MREGAIAFALVFLDLVMPGVSGIDVLELLRADPALKDILVCLITSGSQELETVVYSGQNMVIRYARGFQPSKVLEYLRMFLSQADPIAR